MLIDLGYTFFNIVIILALSTCLGVLIRAHWWHNHFIFLHWSLVTCLALIWQISLLLLP